MGVGRGGVGRGAEGGGGGGRRRGVEQVVLDFYSSSCVSLTNIVFGQDTLHFLFVCLNGKIVRN